jgi:flagellar basal-body rod protein FlgC
VQIGSVTSIALSGLRVQSRRLAQSAENVANVNTDEFEGQRVTGEAAAGGGVVPRSAPTYSPRGVQVSDDGSTKFASNTDLADERVTQQSSLRSFQADVAVLRTSDQMLGELVNLKA